MSGFFGLLFWGQIAFLWAYENAVLNSLYQERLELMKKKNFFLASFAKEKHKFKHILKSSLSIEIPIVSYFSPDWKYQEIQIVLEDAQHYHKEIISVSICWEDFDPILIINNIVCSSFFTKRSLLEINQKLRETFHFKENMEIFLKEDCKTLFVRFHHKGANVKIIPSDWSRKILKNLKERLKKIEKRIHFFTEKKKKKIQKNARWDHPWLKLPVSKEFLKNLNSEILEIKESDPKIVQLTSYLQILKNLKISGYIFPNRSLENQLIKKIFLLLSIKIDLEEFYDLLSLKNGVQQVLMENSKKNFLNRYGLMDVAQVRKFFIIKNNMFFIKQGQFVNVKTYLEDIHKKYKIMKEAKEEIFLEAVFMKELHLLKKSCSFLKRQKSYKEGLRKKYQIIEGMCDVFLKKKEVIHRDEENFFQFLKEKSFLEKKQLIFLCIIFQDLIFKKSFPIFELKEKKWQQEESFWYNFFKGMLNEFSWNDFSFEKILNSHHFSFKKMRKLYSIKINYTRNLSCFSNIAVDLKGHFILDLDEYLFNDLKKDIKANIQGADLWAKIFIFSAIVKSMGIQKKLLSFIFFFYFYQKSFPQFFLDLHFYFERTMKKYLFKKRKLIWFFHKNNFINSDKKNILSFSNKSIKNIETRVDEIILLIVKIFKEYHFLYEQ